MHLTDILWGVYQVDGTPVKLGFKTRTEASHYARTKTRLPQWNITAYKHSCVIEFKERLNHNDLN